MKQLYEIELEDDDDAGLDASVHSCARLWYYRSEITVGHLQNALSGYVTNEKGQGCLILHEFLQKVK